LLPSEVANGLGRGGDSGLQRERRFGVCERIADHEDERAPFEPASARQ
jgi:hypothetical protein